MPEMLSFVSSAADIIARALHGHLLVCFQDFCDEKRKYRIQENINEQLSIPDSTATDDIVYIFENKRGNVAIYLTVWFIPKHRRLQQ